ncbi:MAG TPA: hypothetical protein VMT29_22860, partial [Steroidobacteraceae bacterium]|nr:hypothetical protein [Steroidobacteraceae bacterium]
MKALRITRLALVACIPLMRALPAQCAELPEDVGQADQPIIGGQGGPAGAAGQVNVPAKAHELALPPGQQDLTAVHPGSARGGRWNFSIGARAELTATNNIDLAPPGQESSDLALAISMPLGVRRAGPRLLFLAEYVPTVYLYARNSDANYVQNNLRSFASLEAVEDFLFVDGVAHSYPMYVSPFLPRPENGASITPNRTQRTTLGLSPYVRRETTQGWTYLVRNDNFWNSFSDATLSDTVGNSVLATVESPRAWLHYGLDYVYLHTRDDAQPNGYYQQVGRWRPTVTVMRTLSVSARIGYEN